MNVPMLYVNPLTGPYAGRRPLSYVCQFGSALVLAVFVKPEKILDTRVMVAVQELTKKHAELHAFVVCLSGPDPALEKAILKMAEEQKFIVPICVLPTKDSIEILYKVLPIKRESSATILVYRGRKLTDNNLLHNMKFEDFQLDDSPPKGTLLQGFSHGFARALTALGGRTLLGSRTLETPRPRSEAVETSADFKTIDAAVARLVQE